MTQLNSWDRTEYPDGTVAPAFDLDIKAALQSFSGRTVQSFASGAARDAAFASLTTSQQKNGAIAHVVGAGLSYWTGSAWRPIASDNTLVQSGTQTINAQPSGLCLVPFPVPFATGTTPVVTVNHATTVTGVPFRYVRPYTAAGYIVYTHFHVYVTDASNTPIGGNLDISWIAQGTRGAE